MDKKPSVTKLLSELNNDNQETPDELTRLIADELRLAAGQSQARENAAPNALKPAALVQQAFLRLTDRQEIPPRQRLNFFAIAARSMRRVLLDNLENLGDERGAKVEIDEAAAFCEDRILDLSSLDEALQKLFEFDAQLGEIAELKLFAGLTDEEAAEVLDISSATARLQWSTAETWLLREMSGIR